MPENKSVFGTTGKRRRFQYRLRSLLVFTVLLGVTMKWLAEIKYRADRQAAAVKTVWRNGGYVGYDYQYNSDGAAIPNAEPRVSKYLLNLFGIDFFCNAVRARLTAADESPLNELTELRWLDLSEGNVADPDLQRITRLHGLEGLSIASTHITDAGLERLVGLTKLSTLDLRDTAVTDAGLERLARLTNLSYLFLDRTSVTTDGVAKLQRRLPMCTIDLTIPK
jgi:hypothetical protein